MESSAASCGDEQVVRKHWEMSALRRLDSRVGVPWNSDVQSTLTDLYQLTMAYAYWKAGTQDKFSAFEVFFRKAPFKGSFTILAGVDDVLRFINVFRFNELDLKLIATLLPDAEPEFVTWLSEIDGSKVVVRSFSEGELVYPMEPIMRIEGPLAVVQLLETTVLTLLNFASLITTNAARYKLAAGADKKLLEFGLRRAQGVDGGMTASRFAYMGGFHATSNMRAAQKFDIPVSGTHAHAYVTSFEGPQDVCQNVLPRGRIPTAPFEGSEMKFIDYCFEKVRDIVYDIFRCQDTASGGELCAFINYAVTFPSHFSALVDTYDVLMSGLPNFLVVATALTQFGYKPKGLRIDSGDLAYLSIECRKLMQSFTQKMSDSHNIRLDDRDWLIVASNNINEEVLHSLTQQGHAIDVFGIGTNLVTCYEQPALGMVYKLCQIDHRPVMKISQDISKTTLPGCKAVYRFYDKNDSPILDFIDLDTDPEQAPPAHERIYCQSVMTNAKRCYVLPSRVESMLQPIWRDGRAVNYDERKSYREYLDQCRERCYRGIKSLRPDVLRVTNPTPYKISMSKGYAELYQSLWDSKAPIKCYE